MQRANACFVQLHLVQQLPFDADACHMCAPVLSTEAIDFPPFRVCRDGTLQALVLLLDEHVFSTYTCREGVSGGITSSVIMTTALPWDPPVHCNQCSTRAPADKELVTAVVTPK